MIDICCIGHVTRDTVIGPGYTREVPGGTAVFFSHALSRMPIRYRLVTALAPADQALLGSLEGVTVLPSARTVHFENRYGDDPDLRTQRVLATADPFRAADLLGLQAGVFHLGPLLAGDIPGDIIQLLAGRGRVSLDVQGFLRRVEDEAVVPMDWLEKKQLLPLIYYLKASEEEMRVLTGESSPTRGAKLLHDWGVKEVVITMGSKGSYIFTGQTGFAIRSFPTTSIDVTGCGDTYMAGYLLRRIQGATEADSGNFAAAMATLKIEASGPFKGTEADVIGRLTRILSS